MSIKKTNSIGDFKNKRKIQKKQISNEVKFTFFCMGPGETAQAIGLAKIARKAGIKCSFVIADTPSARLVSNLQFKKIINLRKKPSRVTKNIDQGYDSEKAIKAVEKQKPDVFILCNSKAYSWGFIKRAPKNKPLIISLDSNWLFGQYEDVKMPDWIDKFLIIFPKKAFDIGLKKNNGYYTIQKKYLNKIIPVGFIPSWEKVSVKVKTKIRNKFLIKKEEKLIFAYTGIGITYRRKILKNIFKALEVLYKKGYKFKLIYVSDKKIKKPWAVFAKKYLANPENFNKTLASSDLAVLHQGLSTLFQAIGNNVPVISNIPPKGKYHSGEYHTSFYEIKTFEKLGVCKALFRDLSYNHLLKEIENMFGDKKVANKMRVKQEKMFKPGEKKALNIIIKLLKNREKI